MPGSAASRWSEGGPAGSWLVRSEDVLAALGAPPPGRLVRRAAGPAVVLRRTALLRASSAGVDVAWCRPADSCGRSGSDNCPPPEAFPPPRTARRHGRGQDGPAGEIEVSRIRALRPGRHLLVRPGAGLVVVADAGAFERWSLRLGDRLAVRGR